MKNFTFIDLFSWIWWFHQAMSLLWWTCVFASEIDEYAIDTYKKNYWIDSNMDIKDVKVEEIPQHDVLCAWFPCQAFSKAWKRLWFQDETKWTLFFEIERILKKHHTKYIILENVRNLVSHDNWNTWNTIYSHLKNIWYRLTPTPIILSPHNFWIPQLRERVVILWIYDPKNKDKDLIVDVSNLKNKDDNDIYTIVSKEKVEDKYYITEKEKYILNAWDEFYKNIKEKVIWFPIRFDYFKKKSNESMPLRKKEFIKRNNDLYKNNKEFIDKWSKKYKSLKDFTPTQRKFEWQAWTSISSLWEWLIQFRPSWIRVKKPTCFPALVALVQTPIIWRYGRRLTVNEAAKLQSFSNDFIPNKNDQQAYKQLWNAVNVDVIKFAAEQLFQQ